MKGWRTVAVNALVFLAAFLPPLQDFIVSTFAESPETLVVVITSVLTVVNGLLRIITTTPIGKPDV